MAAASRPMSGLVTHGRELRLLSNSWEGCKRWLKRDKLEAGFAARFGSPRCILQMLTGSLRRRYGVRTLRSVAEAKEPGLRTCRTWFTLFRSSQLRCKEPPPHILISISPLSATRLMNEAIPEKRA